MVIWRRLWLLLRQIGKLVLSFKAFCTGPLFLNRTHICTSWVCHRHSGSCWLINISVRRRPALGLDDAAHPLKPPVAGFLCIEWQHNVTANASIGL